MNDHSLENPLVLDVKNLTIAFRNEENNNKPKEVVKNIGFQLRKGEILGIVGESGSGKSITSLAIMGLIPPSGIINPESKKSKKNEGSHINYYFSYENSNDDIKKLFDLTDKEKEEEYRQKTRLLRFDENKNCNYLNLPDLSETQKTRYRGSMISMIFQEPMSAFNPVYTIGFQLIEAITLHQPNISKKRARKKAILQLRKVKLLDRKKLESDYEKEIPLGQREKMPFSKYVKEQEEKLLNKYPHELSGGQLQRVMIAMAISCNPRILIADEPTTALDVTTQKEILELLKSLRKINPEMSMIFISHDLGVINEIADSVLVMYKGTEQETLKRNHDQSIFTEMPTEAYTKGLLACRPRLNHKLTQLPTVSDFMEVKKDQNGEIVEIHSKQPNMSQYQLISLEEEKKRLFKLTESQQSNISNIILSVQNLLVTYGKAGFWSQQQPKIAVDNVSFDVYRGETLGLVGESGCGKSTLARAILRLIDSDVKGEIIFNDSETGNKRKLHTYKKGSSTLRRLRQKIQIIFQNPYNSLNPRMTVGATILEPMIIQNIYGDVKQSQQARINKAIKLLVDVGLGDMVKAIQEQMTEEEREQKKKAIKELKEEEIEEQSKSGKLKLNPNHYEYFNKYPHELSGGQRQRVCIARALALNPSLIICDESVSALDVSVQAEVLNLLKQLQKEKGLTYIFISHDLSVVRFISDRIMVMKDGKAAEKRIIQMKNGEEVEIPAVRPAYEIIERDNISDYTKTLLDSIPSFPEEEAGMRYEV